MRAERNAGGDEGEREERSVTQRGCPTLTDGEFRHRNRCQVTHKLCRHSLQRIVKLDGCSRVEDDGDTGYQLASVAGTDPQARLRDVSLDSF